MRRALPILLIAGLAVAACGSSEPEAGSGASPDTATSQPDTATSTPTDSSAPAITPPAAPACIPDGGEAPEPDFGEAGPPPTSPDKPDVELPAELPTELVRTVLQEGSGEPAAAGDTVIVDYIGVRSDDGLAFDNSYDREPFPVTLGSGSVIQGWEDGLIGALTGERVQLDIPSELAYGPTARSEIICENEDLTFVIDVRVVVKPVDEADVPTEPGVELSEGATETIFEDLVVGDGAALETDQTAVLRYTNFRGDNGAILETNWSADPLQVVYGENLLPGLVKGLEGMQVGGRRAITIPPADGFGEAHKPQGGLPAGTDIIFLVELLGTY